MRAGRAASQYRIRMANNLGEIRTENEYREPEWSLQVLSDENKK
jgi:hypothetical protein